MNFEFGDAGTWAGVALSGGFGLLGWFNQRRAKNSARKAEEAAERSTAAAERSAAADEKSADALQRMTAIQEKEASFPRQAWELRRAGPNNTWELVNVSQEVALDVEIECQAIGLGTYGQKSFDRIEPHSSEAFLASQAVGRDRTLFVRWRTASDEAIKTLKLYLAV